jgi:shikimate dehydrogenase
VAALTITDVDRGRAAGLLARLSRRWPGRVTVAATPRLHDACIAVNATPLGLRPDDPLPFDPAALPPDATVADIVMEPAWTPLLMRAAELGVAVHPGRHMLTHQLNAYREFFRLDEPPS